jgi:filamentous hemagglutinin family protein
MKSGRITCIVSSHLIRTVVCNFAAIFSLIFAIGMIQAEVTQTPGGGSLNTQVNHVGNVYEITHGTPAGSNLFHSFDSFSIATAETARFQTANLVPDGTIGNILGRVTGGNPSSIFGTVDSISYYPNANLFLMNSYGILFGPGAQINVGGMATFTTGKYLQLEGAGTNGIFYADPAQPSLLTSAPVAAFGFLGSNPAAISVQGSVLSVQTGQSLALVGGNHGFTYTNPDTGLQASVPDGVTMIGGSLSAPSGQINIVSVASAGEISAGDFMPTSGMTMGNITLSQGATLDVSGDGGGTIKIVGGQFVADQAFLNANTVGALDGAPTAVDINMTGDVTFTNGSAITLFAGGTGRLGDTTISGRNLTFDGFSSITAINIDSPNGGGSITTSSQTLNILGGATWFAGTFGSASSGTIGISASDSVVVSGDLANGTQSNIQTESFGFANSGDINIATKSATIENLGFVATDSALGQGGAIHIHGYLTPQAESLNVLSGGIMGTTGGNGSGAITINAKDVTVKGTPDFTSRIQSIGFGAGGTGSILMPQTERLIVADNARINLEVEDGNLNASSIIISASKSVTLSNDAKIRMEGGGGGVLDLSSPTILIDNQSALQTIAGLGGDSNAILVRTNSLTLSGQSQINSSTPEASLGNGGPVTIQNLSSPANSVTIDGLGSGIVTETNGEGTGGSVTVWANQVLLSNGASVSASSTGPGNAGDISINAGQSLDLRDSSIKTEAAQASGGNIDIQAIDSVRLVNGTISTSVLGGAGSGGNITIDPNVVVLQNNSQILTTAVQGAGGNITITTPLFLADSTSLVSASSEFGLNGTVTIQSPTSNLSESLGPLNSKPSQAQSLLTQRCAALVNGQASSFVVAGREQLPADPGGWLSSPLVFATLGENLATGDAVASAPAVMAIAAHDTDRVSLRRLTPAGFLIANFADSEATGCHS